MSEVDPDPDRLIYDWVDNFKEPKWVPENAYSKCKHCGDSFKAGHKHHCRLCGEMFCSACTGKYHLPINFHGPKKHKTGPVRVCHGCRDLALAEKKRAEDAKRGFNPEFTQEEKVVYIWPPEWEEEKDYQGCPKCKKKGGKTHNCRACGRLYCSDCTTKMNLPPYFEKKKHHKPGDPMRVCNDCRFKIIGGAKLVEKPPEHIKLPSKEGDEGIPIKIKPEGDRKAIAEFTVKGVDTDLREIDRLLQKAEEKPTFRYVYTFRDIAIPKEWWDIFTVKILGRTITIREEKKKQVEVADLPSAAMVPGMGALPMEAPPPVSDKNNPFKRKPKDKAEEERKKKEEEEKEAVAVQTLQTLGLGFKAPVGFKKPTLGSSFKPKSSGAAPKKAIPPPPPGFGSLPNAAGAKGDDSESDEE